MIDLRRPTATVLGVLTLTTPLLCAAAVSATAHNEAPPSAPPLIQPPPNPCPKPIMTPSIRLIRSSHGREQTTGCKIQIDV